MPVFWSLKTQFVTANELQKVKNKIESMFAFEDISLMSRAASLATYELLGDAAMMNTELEKYHAISAEEIHQESNIIFRQENSNTLYYYSKN
jgi:predicted Zn-dependent peptidase